MYLMKQQGVLSKLGQFVIVGLLTGVIAIGSVFTGASANAAMIESAQLGNNGKYYLDYGSSEEAQAAAAELNLELAREGQVLLKNDGTLPLSGKEYVSVFGVRSDNLTGGTGTLADGLAQAGFKVNPTLQDFYSADSSAIGSERIDFGASVVNSLELYNDAAVILISRTGGESADAATVTDEVEDNKDGDGKEYDWEHADLAEGTVDGETVYYKHYLQLTDSEEALISYIKARFDKIVVVLNTSNIIEMRNLQNDDAINGILWIGRPGANGINAVGDILSGKTNPSGRTVDIWNSDFTADPTWQNFGLNNGTNNVNYGNYENGLPTGDAYTAVAYGRGVHSIDMEEDIYLGYRYYETRANDYGADSAINIPGVLVEEQYSNGEEWYDNYVVYPFGYGLSYTTFEWTVGDLYYYASNGSKVTISGAVDPDLFASDEGSPAAIQTLYLDVTVKNIGNMAGKDVVQVYVTPPYDATSGLERPHVVLSGFAKTDELRANASQTVTVEFEVQDFAAFDTEDVLGTDHKGYKLQEGTYEVKAMRNSHDVEGSVRFTLSSTANLKLDDFSGNLVEAVFGSDQALTTGESDYYTIRTGRHMADGTSSMTLLSRSDWAGTYPETPSEGDKTYKDVFVESLKSMLNYDADDTVNFADDESDPWYITPEEFEAASAGWTQSDGSDRTDGLASVRIQEMAGVSLYVTNEDGEEVINPLWDEFVNNLTWDELVTLVSNGSFRTSAIPSIDKNQSTDADGPNNNGSTYSWVTEEVIGATWNTELAHRQGIIVANLSLHRDTQTSTSGLNGWYGPGANLHRTPFSGRNNEYYSQDGIHGGLIGAAVVSGAESRGLNVWVKHNFLNDQETNRNGLLTWCSEQAMREIYMPMFQKIIQEGGSSATMTAFNRIGSVITPGNYNYMTLVMRKQWGFTGIAVTDMFAGYTMSEYQQNGVDILDLIESDTAAFEAEYSGFTYNATTHAALRELMVAEYESVTPDPSSPGRNDPVTVATAQYALLTGEYAQYAPIFDDIYEKYSWPAYMLTTTDLQIRAGNELPLGLESNARAVASGTWDGSLRNGMGGVWLGEGDTRVESYHQYYYVRTSATRILYFYVNGAAFRQGVTMTVPDGNGGFVDTFGGEGAIEVQATMGVSDYQSETFGYTEEQLNGSTAVYTITEGSLPAGLSISGNRIVGRPTESGAFTFEITCTIDGWLRTAKTFTITVLEGFTLEGSIDLVVGTQAGLFIQSVDGGVGSTSGATTIYSVVEGALPAGLILSEDGVISGTPIQAGTYTFVVRATETVTSGRNTTTTEFDYEITLTVSEGDGGGDVETPTLTEEEIRAIINEVIADLELPEGGLSETQVQALIDQAVAAIDEGMTADEVQAMIDAALQNIETGSDEGGCGSVVGFSSTAIILLLSAAVVITIVFVLRRNKKT